MSESYTVVLSPQAIEDLRSIYSYIAYELQVPNIAQEQISRIRNGIRALDFLPEDDVLPVGRPFPNTEIILLDENNRVPKPGEQGEICIRGTRLTHGYFANPEKTSEVFVQNPLNPYYPELIYRTGDIGRYNDRGELMFVSRKDNQIKHMGHRIELGEIEAAANTCSGVGSSCCVYDGETQKITLFFPAKYPPFGHF